jgi:hypothetical protein
MNHSVLWPSASPRRPTAERVATPSAPSCEARYLLLDEAQVDLAAFPTGRFGTGPDAHRNAPEGGTQEFWSSSPSEKILISPAMLMATAASGHAAQIEISGLQITPRMAVC